MVKQAEAHFEYKCRRCGEVFSPMVQILVSAEDTKAIGHLRNIITAPGRSASILAIHFCGREPEAEGLPKVTGVGDLIGYTIK